ncbi:MAG: hypothetical protein ACLRTD_27370 [Bacteroides sp.]
MLNFLDAITGLEAEGTRGLRICWKTSNYKSVMHGYLSDFKLITEYLFYFIDNTQTTLL